MRSTIIIAIILVVLGTAWGIITYLNQGDTTDTFYTTIEKITEYNGYYTFLVRGLEVNDINYRSQFDFTIKETTELLWRGTKNRS